jgi:hypothetical protein
LEKKFLGFLWNRGQNFFLKEKIFVGLGQKRGKK